MDKMISESFPRNEYEALTMLYIQKQDISALSPSELLKMYKDVYSQITEGIATEEPHEPDYF